MPWYVYAALTPALYSISTYVDKFMLEKRIRDPLAITAFSGILSGILGLVISVLTGWRMVAGPGLWVLLGAGVLLILYLIPYFEAMKRDDTSRVTPLYGFIPVFTLVLSSVFLREGLFFKQILGMLIVVAGSFFLSIKRMESGIFRPRASLWFMLVSSLMYGIVGIMFRFVAHGAGVNFWSILGYENIGKGIGGVVLLCVPQVRSAVVRQISMIKKSAGILVANDVTNMTAQTSEAFALTLATVPMVNIVGAVQPFMTLIEGLLLTTFFPHLIREDIQKKAIAQKLISIILIFSGLYMVFT